MKKEDILEEIKQSRKYKAVSKEIILTEIERYFKKNPEHERYKDKKILSEIKSELHKIYGSFQKVSRRKRGEYFEELHRSVSPKLQNAGRKVNPENLSAIKKILLTNKSAKERIEYYEDIYKKIFEITGEPKTIVDLGCGLNPFSFIFMNLGHRSVSYPQGTRTSSRPKLRNAGRKVNYYAYDIDDEDISFINEYFYLMKKKISGKAEILNLSSANEKEIQKIPEADVCFMFKLADVLDRENHKQSEKIIKNLNSDYIVVSFSKKTLAGNKMNFPYRGWIEKMLERIGLEFNKIDFENEIFYVIKKNINS